MKDEFYIGWQNEAPKGFSKRTKLFVIMVLVLLPLIALSIVFTQNKFNNHVFEYGNLRTLEGTLYTNPVPFLLVDEDFFPDNRAILLIGFGKFGAEETIAQIEEEQGESIEGKHVLLSGTLIYGDHKALFELTEGKKSLVKIKGEGVDFQFPVNTNSTVKLRGQILDPKCYFGVMKHGEGKIHRSCAIRCISGGIPPVLKVNFRSDEHKDDRDDITYCILRGENGEAINKDVLQYVADPVELDISTSQELFGWHVVNVKSNGIRRLKNGEYIAKDLD